MADTEHEAIKPPAEIDAVDPQQWLNERQQPGNWLAIEADEEMPATIEGIDRTIISMFQMLFTPEVRRRAEAGTLGDDFFLWAAQLVQPEDGTRQVRLNEEVKGVMRLDVEDAAPGRPLQLQDLGRIVRFDLLEEELDCGHFTIFWRGNGWATIFDFRNGRARCAELIASALQFVTTARFAVENGFGAPAVDNLFSACELLSKVQLILSHSPAGNSRTHKSVASGINSWTKLGNGDSDFVKLFNRLSNDRSRARYDASGLAVVPTLDEVELAERVGKGLTEAVRQCD